MFQLTSSFGLVVHLGHWVLGMPQLFLPLADFGVLGEDAVIVRSEQRYALLSRNVA
jgi:hypothetical protein